MGSCISKCRPKTKSEEDECENENVQDKLVISQAPASPISVPDIKPPSPSPSHSTSSFSCSTSSNTSSTSSSSSVLLSSKVDRSFSNEFLWACVKENPHVLCTDPIKESPVKSVSSKFHAPKLVSPAKSPVAVAAPAKQLKSQRVVGSTPQKRVRESSSVLVRQKSFRREPERHHSAYNSLPSRSTLRSSPSPSRRFEGDKCRVMMLQGNAFHPSPSSVRKGSGNILRPPSPNNNPSRQPPCLRNIREMGSQLTVPKIGEIAVGEVLSNLGIDSLPMEDINNPLISLDCFIFL